MIKIKQIYKYYAIGNSERFPVLKNITLRIRQGEFVAITGGSGSGKSTLMNILGCLDTATEGEYELDGEDVSALSSLRLSHIRNCKIGFIFQGFNLISSLTAKENVELPLVYRKVPRGTREELALRSLAMVGLAERVTHKPSQLSGGQQQRVAIARAIAAAPRLILADEPCGNLDSRTGGEVMDILHELHKGGKTIVLITHDEAAAKSAERIVKIKDGALVN